jgi:hypothetical protein
LLLPGFLRLGLGGFKEQLMPEYTRELTIELRAADDGARTAPAVLSTEFPVDRGGVLEVLSHAPDAVDLSRSPIPLLESHNSGALNIGVIENLHLAGRKLRGTVRLGTSQRARELWDDIKVKIVRSLSVGYEWLDHVRDGDTITVTRWRLLEASLIAIPADPGAGLFRSNFRDSEMETENQEGGQHQTRSQKRRESREAAQDLKRVSEINELRDHWQEQFPELNGTALRAVEENWPVDALWCAPASTPIRRRRYPRPGITWARSTMAVETTRGTSSKSPAPTTATPAKCEIIACAHSPRTARPPKREPTSVACGYARPFSATGAPSAGCRMAGT